MSKLVVIRSNDEVDLIEYVDWRSLQEGVGGRFELLGQIETKLMNDNNDSIVFFGNDEAMLINDETNNRVNAIATKMLNLNADRIRLYGDIVVAKNIVNENGEEDSRGFDYEEKNGEMDICETWFIKDKIEMFIMKNKDEIESLHEQYDNNKSEPEFQFFSF